MIEITANDIKLRKKDYQVIQSINRILKDAFKNVQLKKYDLRIFFQDDEEYYRKLGHEKPYRNLVVTDGYYDGEYKEVFIRLGADSIIRTYIHEIGHFLDYNLMTHDEQFKIGSAFTRKIYDDMPFEDKVLADIKKMPAYTLIYVASGKDYVFAGDEIFARLFEVFIWEKLGRKHFTPDLYIKTPKLFMFLNSWLADNADSKLFKPLQKLHFFLLKRAINKRKVFDPYKENRFSHYIENLLGESQRTLKESV